MCTFVTAVLLTAHFNLGMAQDRSELPRIIDSHMHIVGIGSDASGCYVNPNQMSWKHPFNYLKTVYMISAAGGGDHQHADRNYVTYLNQMVGSFPAPSKYYGLIFAFTPSYDRTTKKINLEKTGISVPNDYMLQVAKANPQLIPVGSVHPFQPDLVQEIRRLRATGVALLKILPNSMNFDPADEETDAFFAEVAHSKMVLITHVGDEHSVAGGGINNDYGNPLHYEKWLKKYPTLKIIFAHVGSEGHSHDEAGQEKENFYLVLDLLRKYPRQTYADISAFSMAVKRVRYLGPLLQAEEVHKQLLFGSDYPLPNYSPLTTITLAAMRWHKLIDFSTMLDLMKIQRSNPLHYNYSLMRRVKSEGKSFPDGVFYRNFVDMFNDRALPQQLM
jgi:mannonate dehydratase